MVGPLCKQTQEKLPFLSRVKSWWQNHIASSIQCKPVKHTTSISENNRSSLFLDCMTTKLSVFLNLTNCNVDYVHIHKNSNKTGLVIELLHTFSHLHNKKANREILSTGLYSFLNNSSAGFQSLLVSDILLVKAKHHLCLISGNGEGILYKKKTTLWQCVQVTACCICICAL